MEVASRKQSEAGIKRTIPLLALFIICVGAVFLLRLPSIADAEVPIQKETLKDGVEHWYRAEKTDQKPWFFRLDENIFEIILPSRDKLPFGKSVAFLVGVSRYDHLSPQLPFVRNDIVQLRDFLLNKGAFDEVYVAEDRTVSAGLVQDYMFRRFHSTLGKQDRLMFYYSGHGADIGVETGYMQFSKAKPGEHDHNHTLSIRECEKWSKKINASHLLFVYDCCASGMAFSAKTGSSDSVKEIMSTLSRNGSRTVIAAGTADEKTFGVGDQSVFTKAFLKALQTPATKEGFITIDQIYAQLRKDVANFCMQYNKQITPRRWELEEHEYRGTFLF